MKTRAIHFVLVVTVAFLFFSGCQSASEKIIIDGSSTVYQISSAMAQKFVETHPGVDIEVGYSSTGAGLSKFTAAETNISNASRPIKTEEMEQATANDVEFIELPIAFDGITVVVNPNNNWVDYLTTEELKKIFSKDNTANTWADVREGWPATAISVFAPDRQSGTFDYFTEAITGRNNHVREYTDNEDDNVLINGVNSELGGIGYFGFSYYIQNQEMVKSVPIDNGSGPVAPSVESIANRMYKPLSRPLFLYVSAKDVQKSRILADFTVFYIENAVEVVSDSGYVPLSEETYTEVLERFRARKTGSVFGGTSNKDSSLLDQLNSN